MVLKELVDVSAACFRSGAFHASFLLALCAADATAKKRFPTERHVGTRFKRFLREYMPDLYGVETFWVAVDMPEDRSTVAADEFGSPLLRDGDDFYRNAGMARMVLMEGVLYHAFRCALSHQADLPDVQLLPPTPDGVPSVTVDSTVRISANIIDRLLSVVVSAPENSEVFRGGSPT